MHILFLELTGRLFTWNWEWKRRYRPIYMSVGSVGAHATPSPFFVRKFVRSGGKVLIVIIYGRWVMLIKLWWVGNFGPLSYSINSAIVDPSRFISCFIALKSFRPGVKKVKSSLFIYSILIACSRIWGQEKNNESSWLLDFISYNMIAVGSIQIISKYSPL